VGAVPVEIAVKGTMNVSTVAGGCVGDH